MTLPPEIVDLGILQYPLALQSMRAYTDSRDGDSRDQIWLVEHPPVFTLGQNGDTKHLLDAGEIPVIQVDRGGQVTYHGPGQVVMYTLVDLKRCGIGVRKLVDLLEDTVITLLSEYGLVACNRADAPGVYLGDSKIAALGLRIRRGCSYHGLALNLDVDLEPFSKINPCGFEGLSVTRLIDHGIRLPRQTVANQLAMIFTKKLQQFSH